MEYRYSVANLLQSSLQGAQDAGAKTKIINLFDLEYKDCRACFACKLKGNKTDGICAIKDDLKIIYEEILEADGLVIGSPIYYGNLTGQVLSFINRLLFPIRHYENDGVDYMKKKNCGLIVTMNVHKEIIQSIGYSNRIDSIAKTLEMFMGSCEILYSCNTYQFQDYSKYYAGMFDEKEKSKQREEQFPIDIKDAYNMGNRIATQVCTKSTISIDEFLEHEIKKNK